jgi:hypothetical protein
MIAHQVMGLTIGFHPALESSCLAASDFVGRSRGVEAGISGARLVEPFRAFGRLRGMWRSVLLGVVLAGVLAGCSLGGGSGGAASGTGPAPSGTQMLGNLTPNAVAVKWVSRIPLRFTRTPLKSVTCHATGYEGTATCTGKTTEGGMGTTGEVTIYLRLTAANRPVPTCTPGHGPSPDPTLFCVS